MTDQKPLPENDPCAEHVAELERLEQAKEQARQARDDASSELSSQNAHVRYLKGKLEREHRALWARIPEEFPSELSWAKDKEASGFLLAIEEGQLYALHESGNEVCEAGAKPRPAETFPAICLTCCHGAQHEGDLQFCMKHETRTLKRNRCDDYSPATLA